ncbi:MAG: hypothetical protein IPJ04_01765 [Candidatus Eisenbacteria bacterium]|nr:hypothetical protein [Candidatus Eisenbacteria bacterium]
MSDHTAIAPPAPSPASARSNFVQVTCVSALPSGDQFVPIEPTGRMRCAYTSVL